MNSNDTKTIPASTNRTDLCAHTVKGVIRALDEADPDVLLTWSAGDLSPDAGNDGFVLHSSCRGLTAAYAHEPWDYINGSAVPPCGGCEGYVAVDHLSDGLLAFLASEECPFEVDFYQSRRHTWNSSAQWYPEAPIIAWSHKKDKSFVPAFVFANKNRLFLQTILDNGTVQTNFYKFVGGALVAQGSEVSTRDYVLAGSCVILRFTTDQARAFRLNVGY